MFYDIGIKSNLGTNRVERIEADSIGEATKIYKKLHPDHAGRLKIRPIPPGREHVSYRESLRFPAFGQGDPLKMPI